MGDDVDIRETCASCGTPGVTTTMEEDRIPYGEDGFGQIWLKVTVPVRNCAACGMSYTDWEGEEIREAAVKEHLKKEGPR